MKRLRAQNMLREGVAYRRECYDAGLKAAGYDVFSRIDKLVPEDVLLIWNRYGRFDEEARRFEKSGARVVVTENGYMGKQWLGGSWYAMALGHHSGAGSWIDLGPERWDHLNVPLAEWRTGGKETVILAQRGIGETGIASPTGWAESMQRKIGGRIRPHPGKHEAALSLEDDLRNASSVVTWASSAALKALMLGVPVWCAMSRWIGAMAAKPLSEYGTEPMRDSDARLAMFRRLAWSMWRLDEIKSGIAFQILLKGTLP